MDAESMDQGRAAREAEITAILDLAALAGRSLSDAAAFIRDGKSAEQVRAELIAARDAEAAADVEIHGLHGGASRGEGRPGLIAERMAARFKKN